MSTKIIKMNRGDSLSIRVQIPDLQGGSKNYKLTSNDVLYFALLYPHQRFEDAIILRGWTHDDKDINQETGELTIRILPNDTRNLAPGIYYYTVKLQRGGTLEAVGDLDEPDEVRTIIDRTKFIINE